VDSSAVCDLDVADVLAFGIVAIDAAVAVAVLITDGVVRHRFQRIKTKKEVEVPNSHFGQQLLAKQIRSDGSSCNPYETTAVWRGSRTPTCAESL
jgi:hypothetical protein